MTTVTAYPLSWPVGWERTKYRTRHSHISFATAPFTASRSKLAAELDRLRATDITLSTNMPLRIDGQPYADRRSPDDPGVAVYFTLRGRKMVMARDAYNTVAQNLRSLALAIDHLRGLERHGGATMLERAFTGFTALPEPGAKKNWREVLGLGPGEVSALAPHLRYSYVRGAYLQQATRYHPDKGGNAEMMAAVNAAWEEAQREIPKREMK